MGSLVKISNADNSISINKKHSVSNKFNMSTTYTNLHQFISVITSIQVTHHQWVCQEES